MQSNQLVLYRERVAVCSEIHTKHIYTPCIWNVELMDVKRAVHIVTTRARHVIACNSAPFLGILALSVRCESTE
jgi:hypothetical protein